MEKICDHKSVGVIVGDQQNRLLMLDRARFPFGLAAPAGHVDDHGSLEKAAVEEVFEETGLNISTDDLIKVVDARRVDDNKCRRQNGDYHVWTVFRAENVVGDILPSPDETLGVAWYTSDELQSIADQTRINQFHEAQRGDKVLEKIWLDFLVELNYIK